MQELLTDGSVVPADEITRISLGGPPKSAQQKRLTIALTDVYLAAVPSIERTGSTTEQINQALAGYSLLGPSTGRASGTCYSAQAPCLRMTWGLVKLAKQSLPLQSEQLIDPSWLSPCRR